MQAPRVSRTRAALTVVAGLAAAGAVVGAAWAWLAPPIKGVIALTRTGDRIKASIGAEADNWFTSAFLFAGMLSVLAVVAAVAVWQWRSHRGPVMAGALAAGSVAAAASAGGVGAALARLRHGVVDIAGAPVSDAQRVHYISEAPSVFFGHSPFQIATTLLLPAAVAATVYLLAAVACTRDDLGGWPPVEYYGTPAGPPAGLPSVPPVGPPTGRIGTAAGVPPAVPGPPSP